MKHHKFLATWCKEITHWRRPWYWERLKAGGKGENRGWDGWMASTDWLDGHEFEQCPGVGDGQGSLACCSPRGRYLFIWPALWAPHSSTLAWKIPWMEEPGRLQSMGSQRVRHDWATELNWSELTTHFMLAGTCTKWPLSSNQFLFSGILFKEKYVLTSHDLNWQFYCELLLMHTYILIDQSQFPLTT